MYNLVLVSQSPRRKDLLEEAGYRFRIDTVKVSEFIEENLNIGAAIEKVAQTKAQAYVDGHNHLKSQDILILTADTVVVYNNNIMGKPKNTAQAAAYLGLLSGKAHSVISGLCLWNMKTGEQVVSHSETVVEFYELTKKQIQEYIETGEPMDKAGAYAIQGLGKAFVKSTQGSWSNVVGLPMELLSEVLNEKGWVVDQREPRKSSK